MNATDQQALIRKHIWGEQAEKLKQEWLKIRRSMANE